MKRFVFLIVVVVGLSLAWTGFWFFVSDRITAEVQLLADADGITQPRLTCAQFSVTGFPFQFGPKCEGAEITSGDLTLALPEVHATALFYRPTHVQIFATGPARISDAFTGSAHEVRWDLMRASLRLNGSQLGRLSIISDNLVHADALFGDMVFASAGRAEIHLVDASADAGETSEGTSVDFFAKLENLDAAAYEIARGEVSLDGRLRGLPPLDLLGHPEVLRLWQMADGELTLRALEARAEGLEASASGQAALDEAGRLNATLSISSRGIVERFEGLDQDPMAAMFLGAPDASGTYAQSLSVRGGTVFVGILPIMALEPFF